VSKHGKKYINTVKKLGDVGVVSAATAVDLVKKSVYSKFDESVDVHVNLGIDPTKGDQVVRGSSLLPHGRGKKVRVLVFAKGDYAEIAEKAGADYVGAEDLIEKIQGGWMDFDYAVATPDIMGAVGQLARILGPRGLLPNKRVGTVTFDVGPIVQDLKKGRSFFKNDKQGLVHSSIGRVSFGTEQLLDNLREFVKSLAASRPTGAKGKFIKKITLASTMGPGIVVDVEDLTK
jgi:large subunit ribosomal protein L1